MRMRGLPVAVLALLCVAACRPSVNTSAPSAPGAATASALPDASRALVAKPGRGFVIRGEHINAPDGTVIALMTGKVKTPEDAVFKTHVKSGTFHMEGRVDDIQMAMLVLEDGGVAMGRSASLILDNEAFELKDAGSFSGLAVAGGEINAAVYGYATDPAYLADMKRFDDTAARAWKGVDRNNEAQMARAEKTLHDSGAGQVADRLREHHLRNTLAGTVPAAKLFVLATTAQEGLLTEAERTKMLADLVRQMGPVPMLRSMQKNMQTQAVLKATRDLLNVGDTFQDITVADAHGRAVRLSDVLAKNKIVLLDFWASWCSPCIAQFPRLKRLYAKHHANGFEIYGISGDEDAANWARASKEQQLPWINLYDARSAPGTKGKSASNAWGVNAFPTNYLIGHDGKILAVNIEGEALERAVATAIQTP